MKICVIGSGYVGLVTGACFADLGNQVICIDKDKKRLKTLNSNKIPFYEPGLKEVVERNSKVKRIVFNSDLEKAVLEAEVIFIAVGTPPKKNGEADVSAVIAVAKQIAKALKKWKRKENQNFKIIVNKSTVPVGMGDIVTDILSKQGVPLEDFSLVSNPEFLREGTAVYDFMHPDRIVVGATNSRAFNIISELYRPLNAHIIFTTIKSAELIKYASNSFLATKISFINEIANICDEVGADVTEVAYAIGLDKRIGSKFLNAGIGYGGSCLPKDVSALISLARKNKYPAKMLESVNNLNKDQVVKFARKIEKNLNGLQGKTLGMLGLSFKPETDDLREAPSLKLIEILVKKGAKIKVYDPALIIMNRKIKITGVSFVKNLTDAANKADAVVVVTEWKEFIEFDLEQLKRVMKKPNIFDGRNIFNSKKIKEMGFNYYGIGRSN